MEARGSGTKGGHGITVRGVNEGAVLIYNKNKRWAY